METVQKVITRDQALALDGSDPLAPFRDCFLLPDGVLYLDGNSLGPPPEAVVERLQSVLREEWGTDLIRSWNRHGWIDLPERVAERIAQLIGARADEVMVADSVSVNLFKLLAAALNLRPDRSTILSEVENFGTDLYVAQGLADLLGDSVTVRLVERAEISRALGDDVAVLLLTHVDFRTGAMHDMGKLTDAAHGAGALVLWDLAHSVGAVPVDLAGCNVDLAVGCGYKYLNGGPGAPAFAFVARCHHRDLRSPLWGWMGHVDPFGFTTEYEPAPGVAQLRVGTPPILSLAALECGVSTVGEIGVDRLRQKSQALTGLFIDLMERGCGDFGFELASPRDPDCRGSQVSFRHPQGYAIMQALIAAGVIGDFRSPDLLRFGFAPAYLRFADVWDAVDALGRVMRERAWDRPEYRVRSKVT